MFEYMPDTIGWPSRVMPAPAVTNRTPPVNRALNWLLVVEEKLANDEASASTNEPSLVACALVPAAKLSRPLAVLLVPPATVPPMPPTVLFCPPLMVAPLALAETRL